MGSWTGVSAHWSAPGLHAGHGQCPLPLEMVMNDAHRMWGHVDRKLALSNSSLPRGEKSQSVLIGLNSFLKLDLPLD